MRSILLVIPAALSLLAMAAHFARRSEWFPVIACALLLGVLWVRRPWASRLLQLALVIGAGEWLRTLLALVPARRATGESWEVMGAFLAALMALALLAALAFETAALRRRDGRSGPRMPARG